MMSDNQLISQAISVLAAARAKGLRVATAESCTGGLIAATLTEVAGSSDVFERGFVTYSNEAKTELIDVPAELIAAKGAVSTEVAATMAMGALARSRADLAVAVTGIAGPGGGTASKPVGLVHLAVATRWGALTCFECRFGDIGRAEVRAATVAKALDMLFEAIEGNQQAIAAKS